MVTKLQLHLKRSQFVINSDGFYGIFEVSFTSVSVKFQSMRKSKISVFFMNSGTKMNLYLNWFLANIPILTRLVTPENLWISCVFKGYNIETLAINSLKSSFYTQIFCATFISNIFFLSSPWTKLTSILIKKNKTQE